jgi:ankyrin repeat protein
MEWFQKAIATGAFEEQTQPAADDSESDNSESTSNPSSHDLQSYSEANVGPIQLHLPSETIPTVSPVSTAISQSSGETRRSKPMQGRRADPSQPNKRLARPQRSRLLSAVAYVLRYDRSFYDACSLGNYTSAKKLLERGANINAVSNQKLTALGRALANGDQKMAAWLLNNGADPNAHARYSPTPLHRAVSQGSTDVVALLLEHGADVEEKDIFSIFLGFAASPLLTAASQGHTEIARQLLAHGAKTNPSTVIQEEELDFPLHVALKAGHDETAQLLIESGSLNTMDEDLKRTLLLAAVTGSCQRSLEMLLERGDLNLEAKDNQGLTALDNAVRKDDLSMAGSLMSRGAIPHRPSLEEILRDPLHTLRQRRRLRLPKSGLVERTVAYSTVEGYKRLVNLMLGCDDSE